MKWLIFTLKNFIYLFFREKEENLEKRFELLTRELRSIIFIEGIAFFHSNNFPHSNILLKCFMRIRLGKN